MVRGGGVKDGGPGGGDGETVDNIVVVVVIYRCITLLKSL